MEVPQEPTTTLSTFVHFPRLAPEIRLEIWRLAVLKPRILELECLGYGRWHSPTPCSAIIPSGLHTCHESRQEALKTYTRMNFEAWINFSVDIIYLRTCEDNNRIAIDIGKEFLDLLQNDHPFRNLQFLALWSDIWLNRIHTHNRYTALEALPKLMELSMISDDDGFYPDIDREEFIWWHEDSEPIFEDIPEHISLSDEEKAMQDSVGKYEPQAVWIAGKPWPYLHYLSHDPPEFKFRTVQRDPPAPWTN